MKLVVVGGAPYADEYIRSSMRTRRPARGLPRLHLRARLLGAPEATPTLFCAPTEVGGTHPVILEALAAGNCVARQRPRAERRDGRRRGPVLLGHARACPPLTAQLERLLADPELVEQYRERARERARRYSWDAVADQYEALLKEVRDRTGPGSLPPEMVDAEGEVPPVAAGA